METENSAWTLLAPAYEALFPLRPARLELVLDLCPPQGSFLDAGCATGALVRAVAQTGRRAFGFDLDPELVGIALDRGLGSGAAFAVSDLRSMGSVFPGETFDTIACLGQTLPHLLEDSDYENFFAACSRRLTPAGTLLLQVMNDAGAPSVRSLPVLQGAGFQLERRRVLEAPNRARLFLKLVTPSGETESSATHRIWQPDELAAFAAPSGLELEATWVDEIRSPWLGKGASWILVLGKSGKSSSRMG